MDKKKSIFTNGLPWSRSTFLDGSLSDEVIGYRTSCLYVGRSLPLSVSQFPPLWNEGIELQNLDSSFQHHNEWWQKWRPACLCRPDP